MSKQLNILNKIVKGDGLVLMKNIEDSSVDFILSDLPYGITKNYWDIPLDTILMWKEYERIIKENGAIALFAQSPFDKILAVSNLKLYKYEWIWEKTNATGFLNAEKMPLKAHENILIFYKKLPTYNPIKTKGNKKESKKESKSKCKMSTTYGEQKHTKDYCSSERYPRSVLKFKKDKQTSSFHPTQKPVSLLRYMIETYTNKGDTVLDNCIGSGSTAVACVHTNRNFIGFELQDEYCEIARNRVKEAKGEVGLFSKKHLLNTNDFTKGTLF